MCVSKRTLIVTIGLLLVMGLVRPAASAGQRAPIAVTSIRATTVSTEAVVVIAADGPLPAPTVGTLDEPPRIFLDFAGIGTRVPTVTRSTDARIRRVRAAVHSAQPLVTRVVVDLAAHEPHRIEQSPGRVLIVIGGSGPSTASVPTPADPASAIPAPTPTVPVTTAPPTAPAADPPRGSSETAIPPVPPLPDPPGASDRPASRPLATAPRVRSVPDPSSARETSATRKPYRPPAPPPPAKDLERYREQVRTALDRLRLQQPLLQLLSSYEEVTLDRLRMAAAELQRLAQELTGITPPESLRAQHNLVVQAARLGITATTLRMEAASTSDAATLRNAASAASGAMLMLNRACEDIGCS
jgi:hypothetical protein